MSNAAEVGNDGLDTVAFALDLGLKALHLVPVERVGDILCVLSARYNGDGDDVFTRRMLIVAMIAVKLKIL